MERQESDSWSRLGEVRRENITVETGFGAKEYVVRV